ncbi:RluA family pseudouridine synthase [Granulosicoccus sp.]|nr:RluA family pseudouridine synthase [Granulosicoccus sp.]MDB4224398.1 RluA family pseudouridine synthase [Granulosicoccus sp.]
MSKPENPNESTDSRVMSKKRHVRVTDDQDGQRVDNFLIRECLGVPRSHIYRLIRTGDVLVNGRRIKQTRKLVAGEQVRIPALELEVRSEVRVPDKLAKSVAASIIFEHDDFLILNKPAGVAVHGGSGLAFGLIDALRQSRADPKLSLAHRLDRATSGCLLVGRGLSVTRELQDLFRQRAIEKHYIALVDGQWPESLTRVDAPLLKNVEHAGERRVVVDSSGQTALTYFSIRQRYSSATLVDIKLETGRTHQIRVHSRHSGHAVVGDNRYGDNRRNAYFKKIGLNRLFLHSSELSFVWRGERVKVAAPVGDDWAQALQAL